MRLQLYQFAGCVEPAQQSCDKSAVDLAKLMTGIKACGQERNLPGAVRAFDKFKQKGAQINAFIYKCLISGVDAYMVCGSLEIWV